MSALNKKFHSSVRDSKQEKTESISGLELYVQEVNSFLDTPLSLEDARLDFIYSNYYQDASAYDTYELLNRS